MLPASPAHASPPGPWSPAHQPCPPPARRRCRAMPRRLPGHAHAVRERQATLCHAMPCMLCSRRNHAGPHTRLGLERWRWAPRWRGGGSPGRCVQRCLGGCRLAATALRGWLGGLLGGGTAGRCSKAWGGQHLAGCSREAGGPAWRLHLLPAVQSWLILQAHLGISLLPQSPYHLLCTAGGWYDSTMTSRQAHWPTLHLTGVCGEQRRVEGRGWARRAEGEELVCSHHSPTHLPAPTHRPDRR